MIRSTITVFLVVALAGPAWAGGLPNNPQLVLDIQEGSWRVFAGWKTPEVYDDQGNEKRLHMAKTRHNPDPGPMPVRQSWLPPEDWKEPGFDDTYWPRSRGPVILPQPNRRAKIRAPGNPAEWKLICLRGRFRVTDPKRVMLPRVYLHYHGGAVIYVNGQELQRGHLPEGEIDFDTLADPYPKETYVRPDGRLYTLGEENQRDFADFKDRIAKRVRAIPPKGWLDSVAIPNKMLRKGVNVIAIEVHRAPVNEIAVTGKEVPGGWKFGYQQWPHAGIVAAKMTVGSPTGLEPNVAPSGGITVSNPHPWAELRVYDYSHPQESVRPVRIVAARNGLFPGRILVSSREDIHRLKATPSDLSMTGGGGEIDAKRIAVRFAEPANPHRREITGWRRWPRFDRLLEDVPETIRALPMKIRGRKLQPVPTATVPVWITVSVPEDAAPGEYEGALTVQAEELDDPVEVPIRLKVYGWRVPDTKDFRLNHNVYQCPDSVALYYGVEKWSEKHFELIAKSFKLLDSIGSRVVVVPLCIKAPNINNLESMVPWIKQADGYQYDFSIMEKYLDTYAEAVGKPRNLVFYNGGFEGRKNEATPKSVTVIDPKTGEKSALQQPAYGTDENKTFWMPLFTELRDRLKKRGWYDVSMLGHVSYCWAPTKETCAIFKSMWPDGKWMSSCHGYRSRFGNLPVLCNEWVWGSGRWYDPDSPSRRHNVYPRPWRKTRKGFPIYDLKVARGAFRDNHLLSVYRAGPGMMMHMGLHGYGRQGGDFWPVQPGKSDRRRHLCDTGCALGHAINVISMISPGPDGACTNERVEAFRLGCQMTEATAYIREMLDQKKVTGELARRADALLKTNARHYLRTGYHRQLHWLYFASCGAHIRAEKLLATATEIQNEIEKAD
ncbi:MAG: glycoside hydrolase domain-containing protein [Planctomycetota bacterium]